MRKDIGRNWWSILDGTRELSWRILGRTLEVKLGSIFGRNWGMDLAIDLEGTVKERENSIKVAGNWNGSWKELRKFLEGTVEVLKVTNWFQDPSSGFFSGCFQISPEFPSSSLPGSLPGSFWVVPSLFRVPSAGFFKYLSTFVRFVFQVQSKWLIVPFPRPISGIFLAASVFH